jgi:very-short-patch-repair endonuclease
MWESGEKQHNWKGRPHSEEHKEKVRKGVSAKWENAPWETGWTRRNAGLMSSGEQWLFDIFQREGMFEKYEIVNELVVYPYRIDFAFVKEKVAVEFDGIFHDRRKEYDDLRDEKLLKEGWRTFRISYLDKDQFKLEELIKFIGM